MSLTRGSLARICGGEAVRQPIMQVLGYKKIVGSGQERYRLLLSDGQFSNSFSMLATQLNPMIHNGELEQFTVFRLNKYICNQVVGQSRKVIIMLEVSVVQPGAEVGEKIGSPQSQGMEFPQVENRNAANSSLGGTQNSNEQQLPGTKNSNDQQLPGTKRPSEQQLPGTKRPNDQQPQHNYEPKKPTVMVRTSVLNPSLEEMRTNVRNQYMEQIDNTIDNTNSKIREMENKIKDCDRKIIDLSKKHGLEKEPLTKEIKTLEEEKSLLEKSLSDIQLKLVAKNKDLDNIKKSHEKIEYQLKKEYDEAQLNLSSLKAMKNQLVKDLERVESVSDNDAAAKLEAAKESLEAAQSTLECPVCLETMRPPVKIWMCPSSHLVCEVCKNRLSGLSCPTCREGMVYLRAFMAENFARSLFKN